MKKLLTSFVLLLLTNCCFAQRKESESYKRVMDTFEVNYNADNIDAIYASFSAKFQQESPLTRTKDFLTNLKKQLGKITKREFIKYATDHVLYKTTFEKTIIAFEISVDDFGKTTNIILSPYKENTDKPNSN